MSKIINEKLDYNHIIYTYDKVPINTEENINVRVDLTLDFLLRVHPELNTTEFTKFAVEIKLVESGVVEGTEKVVTFQLFNKRQAEHKLKTIFTEYNGKNFNMYYSVFNYDTQHLYVDEEKSTPEKTEYKKHRAIRGESSCYTTILVIDFDHISIRKFKEKYNKIFKEIGLKYSAVFSGHGVQVILHFSKKYYHKDILADITDLLLKKGFDIDASLRSSEQVVRLPNTYNCRNINEVVYAFEFQKTDKKYTYPELFKILNKIKSINGKDEDKKMNNKVDKAEKESKEIVDSGKQRSKNESLYRDNAIQLPISIDLLPNGIRNMLFHVSDGYRNSTTCFLVSFFKNNCGFDIDKTAKMLHYANSNFESPYTNDFMHSEILRLYNKYEFFKYTDELAKVFGPINFEEFNAKIKEIENGAVFTDNSNILLSRTIIDKMYELSDTSFRIYLIMLFVQKEFNKNIFNIEELVEYCNITKRTIYNHMKYLEKIDFIEIDKNQSKKKGNGSSYIIKEVSGSKVRLGFIKISKQRLGDLLGLYTLNIGKDKKQEKLTDIELKVYIYLLYSIKLFEENKQVCYLSQTTIAHNATKKANVANEVENNEQKDRTTVNRILNSLVKKGFLTKSKMADELEVTEEMKKYSCNLVYKLNK